jgi:predicted RNA-binding protein YlxR (DUF448 family)
VPRRRCVGCGRVAPKPELIRLVALREGGGGAARAVIDRECRMPGRGAYLCRGNPPALPAADCLERARRRGGVARALRRAVRLDLPDDRAPGGLELLESKAP